MLLSRIMYILSFSPNYYCYYYIKLCIFNQRQRAIALSVDMDIVENYPG